MIELLQDFGLLHTNAELKIFTIYDGNNSNNGYDNNRRISKGF